MLLVESSAGAVVVFPISVTMQHCPGVTPACGRSEDAEPVADVLTSSNIPQCSTAVT